MDTNRPNTDSNQWHPMTIPSYYEQMTPLVIDKGEGVYVSDTTGKEYLDSQGGLWCVNVGHNRPELKEAITNQLDKLAYYTTFSDTSNEPSIELTERIRRLFAPEDIEKIFFSSGGSDSVETAMKISRHYWRLREKSTKTGFIGMTQGYHGVHFGGTSLNGVEAFRSFYEPLLPGCSHIHTPWLYRNPWTNDPDELGEICANLLDEEIKNRGVDNIAAFIAEPVQGAGGVIVPPANFWPKVREICDKHDVLLIADEVVTGFGRTGFMSGSRAWGVKPDLMCLAKGISAGYVPLGATAVSARVAEAWKGAGPESVMLHGYTYSGHPLACAAGNAALDIVEKENLPSNAGAVGANLIKMLQPLVDEFPFVGDVRGKGLMMAVELVSDQKTKEPIGEDGGFAMQVREATLKEGLIIRCLSSTLIISPPLTFSDDHASELTDKLTRAFRKLKA